MKRLCGILLAATVLSLSGCTLFDIIRASSNTLKTPADESKIRDSVVIVGRVILDPAPTQNIPEEAIGFGGGRLKDWCDLGFYKDPEIKVNPKNIVSDYNGKAKLGDYFILEVPRKQLWIGVVGVVLSIGANSALSNSALVNIELPFNQSDSLVYIGDIYVPYADSKDSIDPKKSLASAKPSYTWMMLQQTDIRM